MQERKKTRIVLASVLKPVNDVRMYSKMGDTLQKAGYDVFILGYPAAGPLAVHGEGPHLIPHSRPFQRLSLGRLLARVRMFRKLLRLRPDLLIISTHELLCQALWIRLLFGTHLVYDIRENYYRNIRYTHAFPPGIRAMVALLVRLKERIATPFIHHYFIAEKAYADELTFLSKKRTTIVENKFDQRWLTRYPRKKGQGNHRLLFSGTLAASTGVFDAIRLAARLHQVDDNMELVVIGYAAQSKVVKTLREMVKDKAFVHLIGVDKLVGYERVLEQIAQSDFGLILYPPNVSTEGSIPTKLYEYMSYALPVLATGQGAWAPWITQSHAGLLLNDSIDPAELLNRMQATSFYTSPPTNLFWQDEEPRFLAAIRKLEQ